MCREAYCSTGYSPVLAFNVEDLQATLMRCLQQGATMDGSVQHSPHGKARCAARNPSPCFRQSWPATPPGLTFMHCLALAAECRWRR